MSLSPPAPLDVELLVPRFTPDDRQLAFIKATVATEELCSIHKFVEALTLALSRWATQTDNGRAAWKRSSKDFNVGDLSTELPDPELERHLFKVGITNFTIVLSNELLVTIDYWHYDTVLINPDLDPDSHS